MSAQVIADKGYVSLGWMPFIAVSSALALLGVSAANSATAAGRTGLPQVVFWVELIVIVLPTATRLLGPRVSRTETLGLVVTLVLVLYLVKVVYEPTQFTLHDELGQWRSTDEILNSGHLFDFNPIVRAYAYFPGLNAATAALARIGHLSIFDAGTVLVGASRLVGGVSLFLVLERITGSTRLGALGLLVYVCNPNYLYFDAQYAYESLALPLAFAAMLVVVLAAKYRSLPRWPHRILATLMLFAIVMTHHLTTYWIVVIFIAWSAIARLHRRWPLFAGRDAHRNAPTIPAAMGLIALLAWQLFVARGATTPEIQPVARGVAALASVIMGKNSGGKALFQSSTGQGGDPPLAQVIGFASVVLALLILAFGWWRLAKDAHRRNPAAVVFATTALLFPVTLALRFTQAGTETSSRASEFLYVGIAVLAGAVSGWVPCIEAAFRGIRRRAPLMGSMPVSRRQLSRLMRRGDPAHGSARPPRGVSRAAAGCITVLFVGGFIVGWPPFTRQPGPYLAAADSRSVEPIGVQSAYWARTHLPARRFVATDDINGLLMGTYGGLYPQTGFIDGLAVPSIFYADTVGPRERSVINGDKISYLVVDRRLSQYPPMSSGYFAGGTPPGINSAALIPLGALTKFDEVTAFARIYDAGAIVIYATGVS